MKELTKFTLLIIGAALVFVALLILIPALRKQPPADNTASIRDSILFHAKQAQIHHDSAQYHHEQSDQAWKKFNAGHSPAQWDSLRARYRTDLSAKIRAELTGLGDSLRAAKTSNVQP